MSWLFVGKSPRHLIPLFPKKTVNGFNRSLIPGNATITQLYFVVPSRSKTFLTTGRKLVLASRPSGVLYLCTAKRWKRNVTYRDFAHKPEKETNFQKVYMVFLVFGFVFFGVFSGWDVIEGRTDHREVFRQWWEDFKKSKNVKAESVTETNESSIEESSEEVDVKDSKKKKKIGFRDRKIIGYEDRIRQYSTPDKIFRYFATLKVPNGHDWEVFMTPEDFVRSITPGIIQPEGLGLDQFRKFDPSIRFVKPRLLRVRQSEDEMMRMVDPDSIFHKMGQSGLISFSDYIFLLTVLSTPPRNFQIGFRMFDFNGDGEVDIDEFRKVQEIIRNQTSVGSKHKNHANTGSIDHGMSSALSTYFFGEDGTKKLTVKRFLEFQRELHTNINRIEFNRHAEDGVMSERDFGSVLLTYAALPESKKSRMLKRVRRKYKEDPKGITFEEYLGVWKFLQNINDVDTALSFYHLAGVSIDQETFMHVASTVAFVDLSKHVIDVIFTLFDENDDGELSNREFVSVMKKRVMRGLEKPKDTGFFKLLNAMWKCGTTKSIYPD